jgi:hypothetical protein
MDKNKPIREKNDLEFEGIFPTFEEYKIEHLRRENCNFPYPTMPPDEAYMIGFHQCYGWLRREVLKRKAVKG